jgi:hypothetical protein
MMRRPETGLSAAVLAPVVVMLVAWSCTTLVAQQAPAPAPPSAPARQGGAPPQIVAAPASAQAEQIPAFAQTLPQQPAAPEADIFTLQGDDLVAYLTSGLADAAIRLPLAALLGTALALRPRRSGPRFRDPAVVETQIMLAIVGALIMLVVGASLARAFGVAGAANLIRYRAKVDDPKDAVVMLSTLSVGLASGVGLFGVAAAGAFFLALTLWVIEGFETHVRSFQLTVKLGDDTDKQQTRVEQILKRARTVYELRGVSSDELVYLVNAGRSLKTERLTSALATLAPEGKAQIEWKEEKKARPLAEEQPT